MQTRQEHTDRVLYGAALPQLQNLTADRECIHRSSLLLLPLLHVAWPLATCTLSCGLLLSELGPAHDTAQACPPANSSLTHSLHYTASQHMHCTSTARHAANCCHVAAREPVSHSCTHLWPVHFAVVSQLGEHDDPGQCVSDLRVWLGQHSTAKHGQVTMQAAACGCICADTAWEAVSKAS